MNYEIMFAIADWIAAVLYGINWYIGYKEDYSLFDETIQHRHKIVNALDGALTIGFTILAIIWTIKII